MKRSASVRRIPARPSRDAARGPLAGLDIFALIEEMLDEDADDDQLETLFDTALEMAEDGANEVPDGLLSDLESALDQARIDANGGDREARRELKAVRRKLDRAISSGAVHPTALIVFGKVFAAAGLDIGETARAAVRGVLEGGFIPAGADFYEALVAPLLPPAGDDPFALYELVQQVTAIFPLEERIAAAAGLAADASPIARRAAIGFLLHPDDALASAAIKALAESSGAMDGQSRKRIETIRPWLAPRRRAALETAFGPAPSGDLAALSAAAPAKVVRLAATTRDGSGASALFASLKRGSRYAFAAIMIKPNGVVEALQEEDLSRADAETIEFTQAAAAPFYDVRPDTFARILRLALGRNLAANTPPPFALVEVVEMLGHGPLSPDLSTPADILQRLVAEIPDRDLAARIAGAHRDVADCEIFASWFEAGEQVDKALKRVDFVGEGADVLLKSYLPARREFWAAQCAMSALALRDGAAANKPLWRQLALVGRDIAGDKPLDSIPLMRRIAEQSAAHFMAE
jgi:hypothetical protein